MNCLTALLVLQGQNAGDYLLEVFRCLFFFFFEFVSCATVQFLLYVSYAFITDATT